MRPNYKPPINRRFFHSKRRVEKNDLNFLKKKIEIMNKNKIKKEYDRKEKKNL
jgi:hypothetical protein